MLWRMWTYVALKSNQNWISRISALGSFISNFLYSYNWNNILGCFYNGAVLTNGDSVPDAGNPCAECTCQVPWTHRESHSSCLIFCHLLTSCHAFFPAERFNAVWEEAVSCSRLSTPSHRCMWLSCLRWYSIMSHIVVNLSEQCINNRHFLVRVCRLLFPRRDLCWWTDATWRT